ncbi:hypothetical protein Nepgr_008714 [Nepenthes gracilis]|uniref:NAC domain-containing protein n=1 Tax=Nepenthes gracilis TaxID=150966 RepID=A0AAD3S9L1_NEPGR|nr:hypothetical protein Nepgr_008714 [Nepenthes gracilis]
MEKVGVFSNGGMKLPIGFRFRPTDEELLVHYLKRRALSLSLPASVIPDFNVFLSDPWVLPGDVREKRYFFCKRKRSKVMPTVSGFWKVLGKGKQIMASGSNQVLGIRNSLAFYQGKHPHGSRTLWVMHEYHLVDSSSTLNPSALIEGWTVCLIFQRKKKPRSHRTITLRRKKNCDLGIERPSYIDFKMEDRIGLCPPPPRSPDYELDVVETSPCV